MIKVWNLEKTDKSKSPLMVRSIKVLYENKAFSVRGARRCEMIRRLQGPCRIQQVSSLAVLENLSQLAVGLANGSVILMRGDVSRDRAIKQKVLYKGSHPITGTTSGLCVKFPS